MPTTLRKLTFQEAWETMTVFFVDEELEQEIDLQVEKYICQFCRWWRVAGSQARFRTVGGQLPLFSKLQNTAPVRQHPAHSSSDHSFESKVLKW
jgi:hypothetical protein